jgi:hypothetical protein
MFGLLLSLQLSAGKTYFDTQEQDMTLVASNTVFLDSLLAHYGLEAVEVREMLRDDVAALLTRVWPIRPSATSTWTPRDVVVIYDKIQELSPKDDDQQSKKTLALGLAIDLRRMRLISGTRIRSSTAMPLMIVEILWGTIIFVSFGLLAPLNVTAIVSLALCALAVASGFFLIEEMNRPFGGVLSGSREVQLLAYLLTNHLRDARRCRKLHLVLGHVQMGFIERQRLDQVCMPLEGFA